MNLACTCGRTLQIPETLAGKRVRCPYCQVRLTVPGGDAEDLPIAFDEPPPPKPVAKVPELFFPAPAPAAPADPAAELAASLDATLGDLAAAVSQMSAKPTPAASGPVAARPVRVADAPASAAVRPAKVPAAPGQAPAAGGKGGPIAVAMPVGGKHRDKTPLLVVGAGGAVLLIVILIMVAVKSGGKDEVKPTSQKPQIPAEPDAGSRYTGGGGFFPDVRAGRTSADYEREKREREEKNHNPPK